MTAECNRLSPPPKNGPGCGCPPTACTLDVSSRGSGVTPEREAEIHRIFRTSDSMYEMRGAVKELLEELREQAADLERRLDEERQSTKTVIKESGVVVSRQAEALAVLERRLNCDCVPSIISSKSCLKCGRKATIPQEQLLRMGGRLDEAERRLAEVERERDAAEEAEAKLDEQLAEKDEALRALREAEVTARLQDSLGNEGDADAIRRDALREALRAEPAKEEA